ncbi:MAG: hypothetical protein ACRCZF_14955, partial [Gemmataceae bacterium]
MKLDEQTGAIILLVGLGLFALGYLWLIFKAFRSHILWGLAVLIVTPIGGLVYGLFHLRAALRPLILLLLGFMLMSAPYALNLIFPPVIGPIENTTPNESDLTLTDLKNYDYAQLRTKTGLTILNMANADVTDATIEHLRGLKKLRRLDLSNSQLTDSALPILAELPELEDVKLSRTKVTDEGIATFLKTAPKLREITLTGTAVKTATLRDWKNTDPKNRLYV